MSPINKNYLAHLNQIKQDTADIIQCLQMLGHFFHYPTFNPINKTAIVTPLKRVRDSLIHNTISAIYRLLDKKGTDRVCFDRVIFEMQELGIPNESLKTKLQELHASEQWEYCKSIRHGRISHNLDNRGEEKICWQKLSFLRDSIIDLIETIEPGFDNNAKKLTKEWSDLSALFWDRIVKA